MSVTLFVDNDAGFVAWRDSNSDGYVVNHRREPDRSYLKLHRATCRDLVGEPLSGRGTNWTTTYGKTCAESLAELQVWVKTLGGNLDPCGHCHPYA